MTVPGSNAGSAGGSVRSDPGEDDLLDENAGNSNWQRDCPTGFDFQTLATQERTPERSSLAETTPVPGRSVMPGTAPATGSRAKPGGGTTGTTSCIKKSSMRWSDLGDDDDEESDILTLPAWLHYTSAASESNNGALKDVRNVAGELVGTSEVPNNAWDAASATNSELQEEQTERPEVPNYAASEPPRMRGSNKFAPRTREAAIPRQDRQNRNQRHHTKKEVHLPPRPQRSQRARAAADGDAAAPVRGNGQKPIRSKHLASEVEKDHLPTPTRFHREDQRRALSKEMQESAQQMYEGWGNKKRMSTVMAAMEELPKRVGDDMHKLVSHVVDSVQSEINEVSTVIRGEKTQSSSATKAMKHLEVIPTMVLNLLESRMEKAKAQVREKVGGMIQQLSAIQEEDGDEGGEVLAEQMQDMSSEVAKIAGDAVEAAAQECRAHATQQLDIALASLREPPGPVDQLEDAQDADAIKWKKVRKIRNAVEDDLLLQKNVETIFPAATHNAMETALEVIKDKDFMPHSATNEVVADQLLRAKVRGRGDVRAPSSVGTGQDRSGVARQVPRNPGSFGHPDLCPRPCIYFRTGTCSSGADCTFCHLAHSRRPLRLDKRHREALKRMPFHKLLHVVVPILVSKVNALAEEKLSSLSEMPHEMPPAEGEPEQAVPGDPVQGDAAPGDAVADLSSANAGTTSATDHEVAVNMAEVKVDVLQILEQMARNAGVERLESAKPMGTSTCSTGSSNGSADRDSGRDKKVWLRALQVMNLRALLVMVRRLARDGGNVEDGLLLEQIISRIQSSLGKSAPDFEEDEPDRFEAVKEEDEVGAVAESPGPEQPQVLKLSQLVS